MEARVLSKQEEDDRRRKAIESLVAEGLEWSTAQKIVSRIGSLDLIPVLQDWAKRVLQSECEYLEEENANPDKVPVALGRERDLAVKRLKVYFNGVSSFQSDEEIAELLDSWGIEAIPSVIRAKYYTFLQYASLILTSLKR